MLRNPILRISVFYIAWQGTVALLMYPAGAIVLIAALFGQGKPFGLVFSLASLIVSKFLEAVVAIAYLGAAAFLIHRQGLKQFGFERRGIPLELGVGIVIGSIVFVCFIATIWLGRWYHPGQAYAGYPWTAFLILNLLIAVGEETVFRGFIFRTIEMAWGTRAALFASSFLFSLAHLAYQWAQFHLFVEFVLYTVVREFAAGLLLGCAYLIKRRLWIPIGLHWAWDVGSTVLFGAYGFRPWIRPSYYRPAFSFLGPGYWTSVAVVLASAGAVYLLARLRFTSDRSRA